MSKTQQRIKSAMNSGYTMTLRGEFYKTKYLRGWFKAPYLAGCKKAIDEMVVNPNLNVLVGLIYDIDIIPKELAGYLKSNYQDQVTKFRNAWVWKLQFNGEYINVYNPGVSCEKINAYDTALKSKIPGMDVINHCGNAWLYYAGYFDDDCDLQFNIVPGVIVSASDTSDETLEIDTRTPHHQAADLSEWLKSDASKTVKLEPLKTAIMDWDVDMMYGVQMQALDIADTMKITKPRGMIDYHQAQLYIDAGGVIAYFDAEGNHVGNVATDESLQKIADGGFTYSPNIEAYLQGSTSVKDLTTSKILSDKHEFYSTHFAGVELSGFDEEHETLLSTKSFDLNNKTKPSE